MKKIIIKVCGLLLFANTNAQSIGTLPVPPPCPEPIAKNATTPVQQQVILSKQIDTEQLYKNAIEIMSDGLTLLYKGKNATKEFSINDRHYVYQKFNNIITVFQIRKDGTQKLIMHEFGDAMVLPPGPNTGSR
jgi:hypothetical protein